MTTASFRDRRRYNRVGFHVQAWMNVESVRESVDIVDISLAGALLYVNSDQAYQKGTRATLHLELSDDVELALNGLLHRYADHRYAFHRDLALCEADYHLRRLLELNLGDPALIERDIESLVSDVTRYNHGV